MCFGWRYSHFASSYKAVSRLTSFVCVSFVCVFLCCCICHVSMNVHDPTNDLWSKPSETTRWKSAIRFGCLNNNLYCKFLGPFGHRSSRVSKLIQWAMGIFCCKHLFESGYKLIPQIWLLLRCIEVPCSCVGKSWYYSITVAVGTILIHFICISKHHYHSPTRHDCHFLFKLDLRCSWRDSGRYLANLSHSGDYKSWDEENGSYKDSTWMIKVVKKITKSTSLYNKKKATTTRCLV